MGKKRPVEGAPFALAAVQKNEVGVRGVGGFDVGGILHLEGMPDLKLGRQAAQPFDVGGVLGAMELRDLNRSFPE